jgi:hypothetical protein
MKPTSFRLPTETLDLLNRLRLPGESQAALIHRALASLSEQPPPLSVEALSQRIDAMDARLAALEAGSATVVQPARPDTETAIPAAQAKPASDRDALNARVRQMKAQGHDSAQIASAFNAEGIPTFRGNGLWQGGSIRNLPGWRD